MSPLRYALLLALVLLGACGEERTGLGPCDRAQCSQSCRALAGSPCNVLVQGCQERIFAAVRCVRGSDGISAEVRVLSEEDVRAEWEGDEDAGTVESDILKAAGDAAIDASAVLDAALDAGAAEDAGDANDAASGDSATDANTDASADAESGDAGLPPEPALTPYDVALGLLGLHTPAPARDSISNVAGYYDDDTRAITLVDRGEPQDDPGAQQLLAHEYMHALQDQQVGLGNFWEQALTTDARLAQGCLTEGEATLYEDLSWILLQNLAIDPAYWRAVFERRLKYSRDAVIFSESPSDFAWQLRYAVGAQFLADAWLAGGNWAVQGLYEAPPTSTVYWMRGYAERQERAAPLTLALACRDAEPPPGFELAETDTLGAFMLFAFLGHNLVMDQLYPSEESWQRALSWRQDRLEVFTDALGGVALSWRIRLAEEATATGIREELEQELPKLRVIQRDDELEILAGSDAQLLEGWRGTDPDACPELNAP